MAELDYQYIAELVDRAREGDSDSFAELYAATYQKQYMFSYHYLKDEYLAQDALQETYILALKNMKNLKDPKLFVSWLNQINFRICFNMKKQRARYDLEMGDDAAASISSHSEGDTPEEQLVKIDEKEYIIQQVMALPFSESQAIFLYYYNNMKIDEIAYMMEISRSSVKRYLANGKEHLAKSLVV